jgi:hypothetical protein
VRVNILSGGSSYGGKNIITCVGAAKQRKMCKSSATKRQRQDVETGVASASICHEEAKTSIKNRFISALTTLKLHNFIIEEDSNTSKYLVSPI